MRLIDVQQCSLVPPYQVVLVDKAELERNHRTTLQYAILSHRWQHQEVTFKDLSSSAWSNKHGATKLIESIRLAGSNGYGYIWLDTCCIDKDSSAELSEAINSMYRWYAEAAVCYAYLVDVAASSTDGDFASGLTASAWFSRGWTLQELLAPVELAFYNGRWQCLGSRQQLAEVLCTITHIPVNVLSSKEDAASHSIAERMSWACDRHTERVEDIAYSLMGLFAVNMPLLYGEGKRAFIRLQEEILKSSIDYSIFAWQKTTTEAREEPTHGLLADSPADFQNSRGVKPYESRRNTAPISMTNKGLRIELMVMRDSAPGELSWATLPCARSEQTGGLLGMRICALPGAEKQFARTHTDTLTQVLIEGVPSEMYFPQSRPGGQASHSSEYRIYLHWNPNSGNCKYIPLGVLLNQHPFNHRGPNLRGRNTLDRSLQEKGVIGPICIPKWNPGIEAMVLFKARHQGEGKLLFIVLLGTTASGGIGCGITRQYRTVGATAEFRANGVALLPAHKWDTACLGRADATLGRLISAPGMPMQLDKVLDHLGAAHTVNVCISALNDLANAQDLTMTVTVDVPAKTNLERRPFALPSRKDIGRLFSRRS